MPLLAPVAPAFAAAMILASCGAGGDVDRGTVQSAGPASDASTARSQPSAAVPSVSLVKVFADEKWTRPTQIVARPDLDDVLYVIEQGGRIKAVKPSAPQGNASLFMDIRDRVSFTTNEEGLLSLVFHPRFAENREFLVYYSAERPRRTVLSRFKAVAAPDSARTAGLDLIGDPASEEVLLTILQPYWNHNGGTALFGPDGMLYLSIGDGGAANDPHNYGQDLTSLLSKVIRIDVDRREDNRPYAIPADNPFVRRENVRPEIWAYGLRNVWRMSFDRTTGTLWGGDVGQNAWEEIDLIVRGGNYGWNLREGARAFRRGGEQRGDMIDPVIEYPRKEGISVTGGYVYRGTKYPMLQGVYLYADYGYGTMWGARVAGEGLGPQKVVFRRGGAMISSFGEANDGELYVTMFEGGERGPGGIYRVESRE